MGITFAFITGVFVLLLESAIFFVFSLTIFSAKIETYRWKLLAFLLIPAYIQITAMLEITFVLKVIGTLLIEVLVLRCFLRVTWFQATIVSLMWLMITFISDSFAMTMLVLANPENGMDLLINNDLVWFQGAFLSKALSFFFAMLFCKLLKKGRHAYSKKELAVAVLQGATSAFSLYVIADVSMYADKLPKGSPIVLCILSTVVMGTFIITFEIYERYLVRLNQEKEMQLVQQDMAEKQAYYTRMEEMQNEIRKLHHDMKNHLSVIAGLEKSGNEEAKCYADKLIRQLKPAEEYYHTGNSMVDIILNDKALLAEDAGINFEAVVEPNCLNGYENTLLCAIFANALDNALEASKKVDKDKFLRIQAFRDLNHTVISVKNSFVTVSQDKSGNLCTSKENKKEHGIGLSSIRTAVKRLGGECKIQINEVFSLLITLPIR